MLLVLTEWGTVSTVLEDLCAVSIKRFVCCQYSKICVPLVFRDLCAVYCSSDYLGADDSDDDNVGDGLDSNA